MSAPTVARADPRFDPAWRELMSGSRGNLFTSPPWISAVCDTYGFAPQCRVALDDAGRPAAGFAWVPLDDLRGRRLAALPFSDRADPVTPDLATWQVLSAEVVGEPFTLRCLDTAVPASDPLLSAIGTAAWHATPVDASPDELYRRISAAARRNIGVAQRSGVRVEATTGLSGVHRVHALHVGLRKRKYRLLAPPRALFEGIWEAFAPDDAIVTLLAFAGEECVAGALFLVWNDVLYYKFGASRPEHLALRPNDALFWAGIEWAAARGLASVDWGVSDLDQPGLVAYKRKWASVEGRVVTLRPAGVVPAGPREIDGVLGELTRLLTEESVPDDVTERAGALLYRYFC